MLNFIEFYLNQFFWFLDGSSRCIEDIFYYYRDIFAFGTTPQDITEISYVLTSLHYFSYCVIIFMVLFFVFKFIIKKVGELL